MKTITAAEVAALVKGQLKGDGAVSVSSVASLKDAVKGQLSFVGNKKYQHLLTASQASVVLLNKDLADLEPAPEQAYIICDSVDFAFSQAINVFAPPEIQYPRAIHPSAVVDPTAKIGQMVHIGANAVIEAGAEIGDGATICAGSYVGQDAKVGAASLLYPNVTLMYRCTVGRKCIIHPGVVIGADGFGFLPTPRGIVKVPQTGIVEIQDDVEIGANSTIDRARFGKTVIKSNVKIDDQVMIAHNVVIGESSILVAQCGIAGSTKLGQGVVLAAKAGLAGHLNIGNGVQIGGMSGVHKDIPDGTVVIGAPAESQRDYIGRLTLPSRLEKLKSQLDALQKAVAELQK